MANPEHLAKLKEGAFAWNRWRQECPEESPDLSGAHLESMQLRGFHIDHVNLRNANLRFANLLS